MVWIVIPLCRWLGNATGRRLGFTVSAPIHPQPYPVFLGKQKRRSMVASPPTQAVVDRARPPTVNGSTRPWSVCSSHRHCPPSREPSTPRDLVGQPAPRRESHDTQPRRSAARWDAMCERTSPCPIQGDDGTCRGAASHHTHTRLAPAEDRRRLARGPNATASPSQIASRPAKSPNHAARPINNNHRPQRRVVVVHRGRA